MVPTVSAEAGHRKKHRHDLGHEDHGPVMAERTTRGIQIVLGLWIALTMLALVWAMTEGRLTASTSLPVKPSAP